MSYYVTFINENWEEETKTFKRDGETPALKNARQFALQQRLFISLKNNNGTLLPL